MYFFVVISTVHTSTPAITLFVLPKLYPSTVFRDIRLLISQYILDPSHSLRFIETLCFRRTY